MSTTSVFFYQADDEHARASLCAKKHNLQSPRIIYRMRAGTEKLPMHLALPDQLCQSLYVLFAKRVQ